VTYSLSNLEPSAYATAIQEEPYMLVDQENTNILPLSGEPVESFFDGRVFGLAVDDQEVLLRIWWLSDMLFHY
jgi:hypothetical protein